MTRAGAVLKFNLREQMTRSRVYFNLRGPRCVRTSETPLLLLLLLLLLLMRALLLLLQLMRALLLLLLLLLM